MVVIVSLTVGIMLRNTLYMSSQLPSPRVIRGLKVLRIVDTYEIGAIKDMLHYHVKRSYLDVLSELERELACNCLAVVITV